MYLATLQLRGSSGLFASDPVNITGRDGYDNQPSFAPDGRTLYYTSTRDDAQADIYRYDITTRVTTRVTSTAPESEYSATVTPDGGAISVIRVERDSAQRLWRIPLGGGAASVILPQLKPVGYHAWADDHTLALFVLGDPPTLQLADTRDGRGVVVASQIGRSLHRIPGSDRISWVSKADSATWWVMSLDVHTRAMAKIAALPPGVEDYDWLPDRRLIVGQGSTLLVHELRDGRSWQPVADFADAGLTGITRLAVSPAGDRIALVALPARTR